MEVVAKCLAPMSGDLSRSLADFDVVFFENRGDTEPILYRWNAPMRKPSPGVEHCSSLDRNLAAEKMVVEDFVA